MLVIFVSYWLRTIIGVGIVHYNCYLISLLVLVWMNIIKKKRIVQTQILYCILYVKYYINLQLFVHNLHFITVFSR